ncbi:TonB-dependent receptor [Caulobacter sp. D4A]|uniref:TonB-dependent receptor n=1 Tax=Caulobacter sp. D4A TaxID=2204171 RepID=UPI000D73C9C5|nr:TonB-dependent receptor [Caulobacter sp. D4A]PXA78745.1 TonB-dependent receptor [Caulobacter sp. D4A]PXA88724.1 TonB-dependent receptor [Caulobacter sp. D5]
MRGLRVALTLGVSAVALTMAAPVWAQGAKPAQDDKDSFAIETVVVTAQRREEAANDIGMPIQAFSGDALKQLRVTDPKDLSTVAPSFTVSQSYQGVPTYTLRGIGFNTINLSATSTVGTYVDEVAYAYPFMNTGPMFDLERVEVLKGPQGTLYGRNTTAGLVDFVTNKPTDQFEAGLTAEAGNYETRNLEGYFSGPLSDKVQARIAFRAEHSGEGWQKSNSRDERLGEVHRQGWRLSLAAQPSEKVDLDFSYAGWRNRSDTVAAQAVGFTPATAASPFNAAGLVTYVANNKPTKSTQADWAPLSVRGTDVGTGLGISDPAEEDDRFDAAKLRFSWHISDDVSLISLTSYNKLKRDAVFDWSGAPYEILVQKAHGDIESAAEELRLEGRTEKGSWLVGVYVAHDKILDMNRTILGQNANVGLIRFYGATLLATPFNSGAYTALQMSQAFRTYEDVGNIETDTASLFANADRQLTERLKLTVGLRYSQDKQDYVGCSRDFNGNMLPNVNVVNRALFFGVYGLVAPITQGSCNTFDPATASFGFVKSTLDEDNFAWRVALDWQASDDVLVFGSISRGAKAGATPINAANISTQNAPARQELLTAYELGVKAALFDRRVQANLGVFYYDYTDKQLSVYFADPIYTALSRLANVPEGEARGLDGDITWRATRSLTFLASATWLHTEVKGYTGINAAGQAQNFDGRPFLYSPKFQGGLTALFDHDLESGLKLQAALNGRWQDKSSADLEGNPLFAIDSYGLLNASLGLSSPEAGWEVSLWGRNLTDEYYWTAVSSNANTVVRFPGKARTWGAALSWKF